METLSERVTGRLRELAERRGFKTQLAERLGYQQPAITPYVSGKTPVTLSMLEAMSELSRCPVGELVAPEGSLIRELNPDEAALLRALRGWPSSVTLALLSFVAFFVDEPPIAKQSRNMHELWRRLPAEKRMQVYGFALYASEGQIPPEIAAEFFDRLSADAKAAVEKPWRQTVGRKDGGRRRRDGSP